jgi:hypothetical protein
VYKSFAAFIESAVIPHQQAHPDYKRLDGWQSGGNRDVFGEFLHDGVAWKVHADTRFEPIFIAYRAITEEGIENPFSTSSTNGGKGTKLVLLDELKKRMTNPRFEHFYVYKTE